MAKSRSTKQRERFQRFQEMATRPSVKKSKRRPRRYATTRGMGVAPAHNPPLLADIAEFAIPGFGGFVTTKLVANLAASQIAKRWPQYAKHAGAIASVGSFLSAWWLGHRVSMLARWHSPIVVGSAIASAHCLMQIYFPEKLAWIVGSPKQAAIATAAVASQKAQAQLAATQQAAAANTALPDHLEEVYDDPSWYTFNDAYDAGRYRPQQQDGVAPATDPIGTQTTPDETEDEGLASGLFANNGFGEQTMEN